MAKIFSQFLKDSWKWNDFTPDEPTLACPCCGAFYLCIKSMDCLQAARDIIKKPFHINSGHRCDKHNKKVGGALNSQHKKIAFDIDLAGHDKYELLKACKDAGFDSFGLYSTFVHVDIRPNRFWYGSGAKEKWDPDKLLDTLQKERI